MRGEEEGSAEGVEEEGANDETALRSYFMMAPSLLEV